LVLQDQKVFRVSKESKARLDRQGHKVTKVSKVKRALLDHREKRAQLDHKEKQDLQVLRVTKEFKVRPDLLAQLVRLGLLAHRVTLVQQDQLVLRVTSDLQDQLVLKDQKVNRVSKVT
jgi:hypothetical protein